MSKKKSKAIAQTNIQMDTVSLFGHVSKIIEERKYRAVAYANREINLMFWEIGKYINSAILDFKRAPYGKKIFSTLLRKLAEKYIGVPPLYNLWERTQIN